MSHKHIGLILLLLVSCSTPENTNDSLNEQNLSDINNTKADEDHVSSQEATNEIPYLLEDMWGNLVSYELPFIIDKDSLENLPNDSALNLEQFMFLTENFKPLEKNEGYYVGKGIEIYELKENGKYQEYTENLDLAQVKDIVAYPFGKVQFNDALGVIWRIDFSSYEACPFYAGTELYLSIIKDEKCTNTILIAEEWSGGDPPSFGEFYTQLKIDEKGLINRTIVSYTFEEDELIDSTKSHVQHQLEW